MSTTVQVILPIVHDIIPVSKSATLESWVGDSRAVFDKLTERVIVHAGEPVKDVCRVQSTQEDTGQCLWAVNEVTGFHRVVFASNAPHVASCVGALPIGHRALFNNVRYVTHDDPSFLRGIIHTDAERVLPGERVRCVLALVKSDSTLLFVMLLLFCPLHIRLSLHMYVFEVAITLRKNIIVHKRILLHTTPCQKPTSSCATMSSQHTQTISKPARQVRVRSSLPTRSS